MLNSLLADPAGRRIAVVVNEFGEVGVDGHRVVGAEQFVELDNGCLCCAINEDLKRTLFDLADRGGFDHLVVETTGLADPLPVAWTFSRPGLDETYRVDALVTVVDAPNVARALEEAAEAELQIERADLLVLNKLDLVTDGGGAAEGIVRKINDRAGLLRASHGAVPAPALLEPEGLEFSDGQRKGEAPGHVHVPSFESYSFRTEGTLDDEALEDLLDQLPAGVYRAKGLVRTNSESEWTLVNAVAGRFEMEPFAPASPPEVGVLVWIGRNLDRVDLERRCRGLSISS